MKKILVLAFALLFLVSTISIVSASPNLEASIENLAKNPSAFNGRQVTVQGFLVVEQLFAKPTQFYLRDDMDNMIRIKFSEVADISKYEGKKFEVTGVFEASGNEMRLTVSTHNPLEEASPESDAVTGAQNTIVIMAYFTDRVNTKSQGDVYRMVFNDMNGYYMEASYDLMYVTGSWDPWRQLDHTVKYYGQDNPSWWFISDAVAKADPYVNFAGYTKFLFVNAGPNEETSGVAADIWSARWSGLNIPTGDGVTITHGAIVPDIEKSPYGALGVTCHEYAHELGMPDLYTYPSNVLTWDLMDAGSWNNNGNTPASFISWNRINQGWIASWKIRDLPYGAAGSFLLDPLEDATGATQVIRMTEIEYDYYLVEARRRVGFDSYVSGDNVLVLYVDTAGKVFRVATLGSGQVYRTPYIEVQVVADLGWAFQVYVSHKGWSSDKRLTNQAASSYTSYPGGGSVASVGSRVYAVWHDYRDGNYEVYFKRSTNNGLTWGADVRLTSNTATQYYSRVAAYGSYVYVVWMDYRHGNWEIYLRRSENYGASWYSEIRLTVNPSVSQYPSVAVYGRNVHVVWYENRDGNYEIYYKRSTNNGLTWGADTRLTNDAAASYYPVVAAYRSYVYVAWYDSRTGGGDIYFKRSTNNGGSWGADTRLTTDATAQNYPSIAVDGRDVHVAWTDYRVAGNTEIYYRRSNNYGVTWAAEQRLTTSSGSSGYPSLAVKGATVYVVWQDTRTGTTEVFFKDSPDRGVHWTADRILSAQPNTSMRPSVSIAGDNVYVVWTDYRDGNYEIYFKYRW